MYFPNRFGSRIIHKNDMPLIFILVYWLSSERNCCLICPLITSAVAMNMTILFVLNKPMCYVLRWLRNLTVTKWIMWIENRNIRLGYVLYNYFDILYHSLVLLDSRQCLIWMTVLKCIVYDVRLSAFVSCARVCVCSDFCVNSLDSIINNVLYSKW